MQDNGSWKTTHRSFYYQDAPEPVPPPLDPARTALLVIDIQNTYLERPDRATLSPEEQARHDLWTPFHERMRKSVIPNTAAMLEFARKAGMAAARRGCGTAPGVQRLGKGRTR